MKTITALLCVLTLSMAADVRAQQQTQLKLPTDGGWDVAGQLGLFNRNRAELSGWDQWYSVAAIDASVGRYWTPHLKTEFEISTAAEGRIDGQETISAPGLTFPYQRYREHRLRETTVGATAQYQFLENAWVHPFIGAGIELVRERHSADALTAETVRFSTAVPALRLPDAAAIDAVTYSARPVLTGGFKFYVSPHAFVRTDVRTAWSTDRTIAWQWRGGIGFDF